MLFWLPKAANELQRGESSLFKLENIDFGRRVAVERDLLAAETALRPNAIFDDTSNFLLYPTLLGIKVSATPVIMLDTENTPQPPPSPLLPDAV